MSESRNDEPPEDERHLQQEIAELDVEIQQLQESLHRALSYNE